MPAILPENRQAVPQGADQSGSACIHLDALDCL